MAHCAGSGCGGLPHTAAPPHHTPEIHVSPAHLCPTVAASPVASVWWWRSLWPYPAPRFRPGLFKRPANSPWCRSICTWTKRTKRARPLAAALVGQTADTRPRQPVHATLVNFAKSTPSTLIHWCNGRAEAMPDHISGSRSVGNHKKTFADKLMPSAVPASPKPAHQPTATPCTV